MAEILLPIIPHLDDYECLICASVAFKPVRLACGHLFCVRFVFSSHSLVYDPQLGIMRQMSRETSEKRESKLPGVPGGNRATGRSKYVSSLELLRPSHDTISLS